MSNGGWAGGGGRGAVGASRLDKLAALQGHLRTQSPQPPYPLRGCGKLSDLLKMPQTSRAKKACQQEGHGASREKGHGAFRLLSPQDPVGG